jgi:REP element-mobilizing transposase RayT
MRDLPVRKYPRLKDYDYCQSGAYFVTFCTRDRHELLGQVVGSGFHPRPSVELTELGVEVQNAIEYVQSNSNNAIIISKYVIMPNHVHMIVILSPARLGDTVGDGTPTLQSLVGRIKSYTTKRWNVMGGTEHFSFWQRSFHEHIIRNESEYHAIWQYINDNPMKWTEDKYYQQ